MCGIAGVISSNPNLVTRANVSTMLEAIAHRGPNGAGTFVNPSHVIALGHQRLSIIDLSDNAAQPMHYLERYTIVHNGEIYNYLEIKKELLLKGYSFQSTSDTEVILAAYDCWGVNCLQHFDGMFAFVIWDELLQKAFFARDRFGEKPLYYYQSENSIYFASEMKALWAIGVPNQINNSMLCTYIGTGLTSIAMEPQLSFYKSIVSLPPAHFAEVNLQKNELVLKATQYWDIDKVSQITLSEDEATEKLLQLLTESISKRLRSDVAIGTSLSGGLDSSSITAILQQLNIKEYNTFSAVFPGFELDETNYIDAVTKQYGIANHKVAIGGSDFEESFNAIIATQEQPFISSSVFAQYKVMQMAKNHGVKVLLDGQGADESLAGYTKYVKWYLQELFLFDKVKFKSEILQHKEGFGILNKLAAWFPAAASTRLQRKATKQLQFRSYLDSEFVSNNFSKLFIYKPMVKKLNDLLYFNTMQQGLDELLRYADKNSMAHGVEVRLPFLQHELVQFVFSLPAAYKIKNGYQKHILRKAVGSFLPNEITWRKNKVGYDTPQSEWLNTPFFKNKIQEAKQKLVAQNILSKNVLNAKVNDSLHWRYLIAAEYI